MIVMCVCVAFTCLHGVQHERVCLLQTTPHNMYCVHVCTVCALTAFITIIMHVSSVHITHYASLYRNPGVNLPGESGQLGINEDLFFR